MILPWLRFLDIPSCIHISCCYLLAGGTQDSLNFLAFHVIRFILSEEMRNDNHDQDVRLCVLRMYRSILQPRNLFWKVTERHFLCKLLLHVDDRDKVCPKISRTRGVILETWPGVVNLYHFKLVSISMKSVVWYRFCGFAHKKISEQQ